MEEDLKGRLGEEVPERISAEGEEGIGVFVLDLFVDHGGKGGTVRRVIGHLSFSFDEYVVHGEHIFELVS